MIVVFLCGLYIHNNHIEECGSMQGCVVDDNGMGSSQTKWHLLHLDKYNIEQE